MIEPRELTKSFVCCHKGGNVAAKDEWVNTVYGVKTRLRNLDGLPKPGMTADAVLQWYERCRVQTPWRQTVPRQLDEKWETGIIMSTQGPTAVAAAQQISTAGGAVTNIVYTVARSLPLTASLLGRSVRGFACRWTGRLFS